MWERVRRKQVNGIKFYRQYIIEHADILGVKAFFIADFYCHPQKLIIEIDGDIHLTCEQKKYDKERSEVLREMGYRIIRFTNQEVLENWEEVQERLLLMLG